MGRMNLRCSCGQTFVVDSTTFDTAEFARCPGCGSKVGIDGPILEGPAPRKKAARPAVKDMKKTHLILGGVGLGAVLFFGILILILSMSSGENDMEVANSGHGPRAVSRKAGDVRYPTDLLTKPQPATTAPKPAVAPKDVRPLPPLPPPTTPAPTPKPAAPATPQVAPPPKPVAPEASKPFSPDLVRRLREDILSLPQFYLKTYLPAENRRQVEAKLAAGKGTSQDVAFLESLLSDLKLENARQEYKVIRSKYENLQREAFTSLPVDQLTLTDGRKLPGKILEVTTTSVRLERKIRGVGGVMTFPRSQVREVGKGKGVGGEFKKQWDGAKGGSTSKLESLMAWCGSKNLGTQRDLVAYAILMKDPGHPSARQAAALAATPSVVAAAPGPNAPDAPPPTSGPIVEYQGRKWAPRDLKDSLLRKGYAVIGGKWYRGEKKLISVPGLFRYMSQSNPLVRISSTTAPLNADRQIRFKPKLTAQIGTGYTAAGWSLVPDSVNELSKFFAPTLTVTRSGATGQRISYNGRTASYPVVDKAFPRAGQPASGEVVISVPVGQPLLSASIMTLAEVKSGAQITIYLQKGAIRTKLYSITGKYSRTFELPADLVKGLTQLDLVAVINMPAAYKEKTDKHTIRPLKMDGRSVRQYGIEAVHTQQIPDYHAKLFPSGPRTREVFRLRGMVGEAAVGLDKVFEDFPNLLQ